MVNGVATSRWRASSIFFSIRYRIGVMPSFSLNSRLIFSSRLFSFLARERSVSRV